MSNTPDRIVLFGLLAHQLDFINVDQLEECMRVWVLDKAKSLGEILVANQWLDLNECRLLDALVDKYVEKHGGDLVRSLQQLSSVDSDATEILKQIRDNSLDATLQHFSAQKPGRPTGQPCEGQLKQTSLRFQIIRPHAKGGLGEVFVAKDTELSREVALKEIQGRHADSEESRERFLREAEITGNLEHPGIVPVYGLGKYDNGRPFYAMRFIRGESLKEAIDNFHEKFKSRLTEGEAGLELRKLLGRLVDVCNAIAYAHSRGVLHRDLKPGNIVLGRYGETLVVDWGLAKAQGCSGESESALGPVSVSSESGTTPTMQGAALGTPAYMSPEQAAGRIDELNGATDVYSLGATLFHLLTGQAPIVANSPLELVSKAAAGDIRKPREIRSDVPKSLEAVCLKAMARSANERYASPVELADDIEKWLADEPLSAYRRPTIERMKYWVKKHPKTVSATSATLLVSVIGAGLAALAITQKNTELYSANLSLESAKRKQENLTELAITEQKKAEQYLEESRTILNFVEAKVLASARPEGQDGGLGRNVTVREAISSAKEAINGTFDGKPTIEAAVRHSLGLTYSHLGEYGDAIEQFQLAVELRNRSLGLDNKDTLQSLSNLAGAYYNQGDLKLAIKHLKEALNGQEKMFGKNSEEVLDTSNNLAVAYWVDGEQELAREMFREVVEKRKRALGEEDLKTLDAMTNYGQVLRESRRNSESLAIAKQVLEIRERKLGPRHPDTLEAMNTLGMEYLELHEYATSLPLLQKAVELREFVIGPSHPLTFGTMNNLAIAYGGLKQFDDAIKLASLVYERMREVNGPEHYDTRTALSTLAFAYDSAGMYDDAIKTETELIAMFGEAETGHNPTAIKCFGDLGSFNYHAGNYATALELLEQAIELEIQAYGPDSPRIISTYDWLVSCYLKLQNVDRAYEICEKALKLASEVLSEKDDSRLGLLFSLGEIHVAQKDFRRAEKVLVEYVSIRTTTKPNSWELHAARSMLGQSVAEQGRIEEAKNLLLDAMIGLDSIENEIPRCERACLAAARQRIVDYVKSK